MRRSVGVILVSVVAALALFTGDAAKVLAQTPGDFFKGRPGCKMW